MNFSNTQNEILEIEITKKGFLKEKKRFIERKSLTMKKSFLKLLNVIIYRE